MWTYHLTSKCFIGWTSDSFFIYIFRHNVLKYWVISSVLLYSCTGGALHRVQMWSLFSTSHHIIILVQLHAVNLQTSQHWECSISVASVFTRDWLTSYSISSTQHTQCSKLVLFVIYGTIYLKGKTILNYILHGNMAESMPMLIPQKALVCRLPRGSTPLPAGETNCSARNSMYSMVATLTGHLESFASSACNGCLKGLGQLAMHYQLLEVVEEAFIH